MSAMKADPEELKARISRGPFNQILGLQVDELGEGYALIRMPAGPNIMANERYVHGGAIGALIDVAGDWAVATQYGRPVPTIDMRVDFLSSGRPGEDLLADARLVKLGRSVSVADVRVFHPGGKAIAVGRALYSTPVDAE
jgi:uncharacterized protein (TIGR00369 family)